MKNVNFLTNFIKKTHTVVVQMTNGSLDDKKLDDRGIILDDRGGMFDDRQHDRRMRRSEKGPPVASVSVLRIVAISGKVSVFPGPLTTSNGQFLGRPEGNNFDLQINFSNSKILALQRI